jgi:hypothetical protein
VFGEREMMLDSRVYFDMWLEAREMEALQREIDAFAKTHKHYSKVRKTMAKLLHAGLANTLSSAYRKACKLRGLK